MFVVRALAHLHQALLAAADSLSVVGPSRTVSCNSIFQAERRLKALLLAPLACLSPLRFCLPDRCCLSKPWALVQAGSSSLRVTASCVACFITLALRVGLASLLDNACFRQLSRSSCAGVRLHRPGLVKGVPCFLCVTTRPWEELVQLLLLPSSCAFSLCREIVFSMESVRAIKACLSVGPRAFWFPKQKPRAVQHASGRNKPIAERLNTPPDPVGDNFFRPAQRFPTHPPTQPLPTPLSALPIPTHPFLPLPFWLILIGVGEG